MSSIHRAVVLCTCVVAFSGGFAHAIDIEQDFRNDLPPGVLEITAAGRQWSRETPRGLLITIPGNRTENVAPAGFRVRKSLTGDFEATLEYELVTAEDPDAGYGSGVILWARPEGPTGKFSVGRAQISGAREGSFFTAYCAAMDKEPAKGKKYYFPT